MDMRKTAHLTAAEQRAAARETLADGVDGVNLDFTEVGEFLQSLPGPQLYKTYFLRLNAHGPVLTLFC